MCLDPRSVIRTYTPPIEHEVSRFTISEAPEDGCAAEDDNSRENVEDLYGSLGQYGVIQSGGPQMLIGDGRLPERQRVCDPVGKQGT